MFERKTKDDKVREAVLRVRTAKGVLEKGAGNADRVKREHRERAAAALRSGDERRYKASSRKYAFAEKKANTFNLVLEMTENAESMIDLLKSVDEVRSVMTVVNDAMESVGVDPKMMEKSIFNLNKTSDRLQGVVEQLSDYTDAMVETGDVSSVQDELRAELMAELQAEKALPDGLGERIRKERA